MRTKTIVSFTSPKIRGTTQSNAFSWSMSITWNNSTSNHINGYLTPTHHKFTSDLTTGLEIYLKVVNKHKYNLDGASVEIFTTNPNT